MHGQIKMTYKRLPNGAHEVQEEVEAPYYADAGDWIDYEDGGGGPVDGQVVRVRADQVKRIERLP